MKNSPSETSSQTVKKAYILTGDLQASLDFMDFQNSTYYNDQKSNLENYQPLPAQQAIFPQKNPALYFKPSTSSEKAKY
jgi:hypothetical protein